MTDMSSSTVLPEGTAATETELSRREAPFKAPVTSKSDCVTKLLRRAKGATVAELQEVTSWQPHSVRAFLSGLRKKGSAVSKEQRNSGETAYHIRGKAASAVAGDA